MTAEPLSRRALNRALLARQDLLRRREADATAVVERLVGMQAQEPEHPYVGLRARLAGFEPEDLGSLLESRAMVRAIVMRGTIHLVSAADCHRIQPRTMDVLDRGLGARFKRELGDLDRDELIAACREELRDGPRTRAELATALERRWPDADRTALGLAATYWLALVQATPRGVWGHKGAARWVLTEDWLGASDDEPIALGDLIRRYLSAFGPASVGDMRTWSGLTGLRAGFEGIREELRTFRDEGGRELFDVPDAPVPDPDTPAPVRLLPHYDNVFLSHEDRARILETPTWYGPHERGGGFVGPVLVDGFVRAFWALERSGEDAAIRIVHLELRRGDPGGTREEIVAEAEALLEMIAPGAGGGVRFG